jgi:integrase
VPGSQHKNGKPHSVPLNEMALAVLRKQLGRHPTRVFTFRGQTISQVNTKAWTAALSRAGIEHFRWHDLRHTFATWHRQAGTPTHELQRLGGLEDRCDGRALRACGARGIAGRGESA